MRLPFAYAKKHGVLLETQDDEWVVWHRDDTPLSVLMELQRTFDAQPWTMRALSEAAFEPRLQQMYAEQPQADFEGMDALALADLNSLVNEVNENQDLLENQDDAPIIKLLNAVLSQAIRAQASDIHIEPFENQLRIRFRLDGQLKTVLTPKAALATMLVSRIKVMARLDIAEKRLPQDGRIALKLGGRAVDLRVSTIPSSFGERVVLRLLDKSAGRLDLADLGMPAAVLAATEQVLAKPHGIFLVTGPTGSGKTTTLYAGLTRLNTSRLNIMTIEDPVEYNLMGINQTQVNAKADMTFAKGLRAILRQDPDVVMIGEIRDAETAQIAVQSSLTGHLVLSTLHTNTAIGAITRLRDMGVEPFLLASSLSAVLAQRLVRRLCAHCKQAHQADEKECECLGVEQALIYRAQGCEQCNHTGYQGRIGIYEMVVIDDQIQHMIHLNESELAIERYVRQRSPSLQQGSFLRVLNGETSLDEVLRVTQG
ncbi:MAG: type II secretion system ATPase GspE [Thiomicrospira sp.]